MQFSTKFPESEAVNTTQMPSQAILLLPPHICSFVAQDSRFHSDYGTLKLFEGRARLHTLVLRPCAEQQLEHVFDAEICRCMMVSMFESMLNIKLQARLTIRSQGVM